MLRDLVQQQGADLGIAFDGDGDRVIMVDHRGEVLDGDELLFIIARDRLRTGSRFNAVVGTLMTNLGLEIALRALGLDLRRAKVGDRYVMEGLLAENLILGGENSGHIICLDRTTTGDGIISALQVLSAMLQSGKSLHDLKAGMSKYPQVLINVSVTGEVDLRRPADSGRGAGGGEPVGRPWPGVAASLRDRAGGAGHGGGRGCQRRRAPCPGTGWGGARDVVGMIDFRARNP